MICWKINRIFKINGLGFGNGKKNNRRNKKFYILNFKKHFGFINCYYFNQRGHHIKDCSYRNGNYVLKPNERLLWSLKDLTSKSYPLLFINIARPKTNWISSSKE